MRGRRRQDLLPGQGGKSYRKGTEHLESWPRGLQERGHGVGAPWLEATCLQGCLSARGGGFSGRGDSLGVGATASHQWLSVGHLPLIWGRKEAGTGVALWLGSG